MQFSTQEKLTPPESGFALVTAGAGAVTAMLAIFGTGTLVERMVRNEPCLSLTGFLGIETSIVLAVFALALSGLTTERAITFTFCFPAIFAVVLVGTPFVATKLWNLDCHYSTWGPVVGLILVILLILSLGMLSVVKEQKKLKPTAELNLGRSLLLFSTLLFSTGILILTVPAMLSFFTEEQPSVSAKLKTENGRALEITVNATGIAAVDEVAIRIDRMRSIGLDRWETTPEPSLYSAFLGPTSTGLVATSFELPLPIGDYDSIGVRASVGKKLRVRTQRRGEVAKKACGGDDVAGCTFILMPSRSLDPQLTASWEANLVVANIKAQDLHIGGTKPQSVLLQVFGRKKPESLWSDIYSSVLTANAAGTIDTGPMKIPVPQSYSEVCLTAQIETGRRDSTQKPPVNRCGMEDATTNASSGFEGVWSHLRRPRSSSMRYATAQSDTKEKCASDDLLSRNLARAKPSKSRSSRLKDCDYINQMVR